MERCKTCRHWTPEDQDEYGCLMGGGECGKAHAQWFADTHALSPASEARVIGGRYGYSAEAVQAAYDAGVAAERERWATCTANLLDAVVTCIDIAPGCAIDDWVKDARRLLCPNDALTGPRGLHGDDDAR